VNIALVALNFLPARGGMEFVVHDLADALHDLGHNVTVFAPRWKNLPPEQDHRYRLVRFGWNFRGAFRLGFNRWPLKQAFGRLHREKPFDVINSHSAHLTTSYANALKRKFGVPVVVTCHGHDIQRDPTSGYGLRLNPKDDRLIRSNLASSNLAVSISSSVYEDLAELLPANKIVSIPNGIDVEASDLPGPWLREQVSDDGDIIVISVGRNVPKKSLNVGLKAFALAVAEVPNLRYVHIGRDGEPLERLASELGVSERFHALGEQPRDLVLRAYREADMFFSPAAVESFGVVTLEAMAAGLPSVVSDGPGNRDIIVYGETGTIAPVGDVDLQAAGLIELARDDRRRREYGDNALHAVGRYAWPRVADEYLKAFATVAIPTAVGE
jgi:glycosyltransferase involved in cell wall biosynthesis